MFKTAKLYLKPFLFFVIPFGLALLILNHMFDLGMHSSTMIFTTIIAGGFYLGSIAREKRKSDF